MGNIGHRAPKSGTPIPPEKSSTHPTAHEILAEAGRLQRLYRRAIRVNRGGKKGRRPGPRPGFDIFVLEARSRAFAGSRLSRSERASIDRQLLVGPKWERSAKLGKWRASYPADQVRWQGTWDALHEAQRIARMVPRGGSLSARSIQQKRGISRRRLDELMPLVVGWNAGLEARVRGRRMTFKALPVGSPELTARIRKINASVEAEIRAASSRRP